MRVLLWHVHGSWTTSLVHGAHEYLVPVTPSRDPDGLGRARTYDWPGRVVEVPLAGLRAAAPDVVVLQRPRDLELVHEHLGAEPGRDLPAVYVEHNTPRGDLGDARHPLADRCDIPLVHVTHFNALYWDSGRAPTTVVEHGVVDPGLRYTGELARAAVVVNDPVRRGRITGTDLLAGFASAVPLDVFGMNVGALRGPDVEPHEDLPQSRLHREISRRRAYLHPARWTSLGLSLLEAMHLGMPVVALAATEAADAVPRGAGVVSARVDVLRRALRDLVHDPDLARATGLQARRAALARFGLARFLADWDRVLTEVTA